MNKFRTQRGMTREQLAARIPISGGHMGQIIKGTAKCSRDVAEKLDKVLGAGGEIISAWERWVDLSGDVRPYAEFSELEGEGDALRALDTLWVYGLLQTEDYARSLLPTPAAVERRMARQKRVFENPNPPKIFTIMDESVLHRMGGSPYIMREQLEFLHEAAKWPNVCLQIMPWRNYGSLSVTGSFSLVTRDLNTAAFLDNQDTGETSLSPEVIGPLLETFATLQAQALNIEDSQNLISETRMHVWS
nr:helix-turn-helix transcriptional regulator [Actinomadura flavalba]